MNGKDLPLETRASLNGILSARPSPVYELGDLGRRRAVCVLLELPDSPEKRAALERYAKGPAWSYAAELARRWLRTQIPEWDAK